MAPSTITAAPSSTLQSSFGGHTPANGGGGGGLSLRSASTKLEDEPTQGPTANWEVAYVYAFLTRFTEWRNLKDGPMTDVTVFEQELVNSSPPPGSKLIKTQPPPRYGNNFFFRPVWQDETAAAADDTEDGADDSQAELGSEPAAPAADDKDATADPLTTIAWGHIDPTALEEQGGIPPASQLLADIIKSFEKYLYLPEFENSHGRRDWFSWLVRFVNKRLLTFQRGGFRWTHNLLKRVGVKSGSERDQEFWLLSWEDKIHVMRQMVDYQLMHSKPIRQQVDAAYDLGKQRLSKRESTNNDLVIDHVGTVKQRELWKIDDSPRLYASSSPYKKDFQWRAVSSTVDGYQRYIESLPPPNRKLLESKTKKATDAAAAPEEEGAAGGAPPAKKQKTAAAAAVKARKVAPPTIQTAVGSGKKTKSIKMWEEQSVETLTRARLEDELPNVLEFQKAVEALHLKRFREEARATRSSRGGFGGMGDARLARQTQRYDPFGTALTRSTRQRTSARQAAVYYGEIGEDSVDSPGESSEPAATSTGTTGRSGRRSRPSVASLAAAESEAASFAAGGGGGGGEWADADDSDVPAGRGKRSAKSGSVAATPEWKGERRSSRIHHKSDDAPGAWEEEDQDGAHDVEAREDKVAPQQLPLIPMENGLPPLPDIPDAAVAVVENGAVQEDDSKPDVPEEHRPVAKETMVTAEPEAKPASPSTTEKEPEQPTTDEQMDVDAESAPAPPQA